MPCRGGGLVIQTKSGGGGARVFCKLLGRRALLSLFGGYLSASPPVGSASLCQRHTDGQHDPRLRQQAVVQVLFFFPQKAPKVNEAHTNFDADHRSFFGDASSRPISTALRFLLNFRSTKILFNVIHIL